MPLLSGLLLGYHALEQSLLVPNKRLALPDHSFQLLSLLPEVCGVELNTLEVYTKLVDVHAL